MANMMHYGRVEAINMGDAIAKARLITPHFAIHELDKYGDEVWDLGKFGHW